MRTRHIIKLTTEQRRACEIFLDQNPEPPAKQGRNEPHWKFIKWVYLVDGGMDQQDAMVHAQIASKSTTHAFKECLRKDGFDALRIPEHIYTDYPMTHVVVTGDTLIAVNEKGNLKFYVYDGTQLLHQPQKEQDNV